MTAKTRVLVVGPAPPGRTSRGGMATVIGHMAAHPGPSVRIRLLTTYVDAAPWTRLTTGLRGMLRGMCALARREVDVVHVHLSHGGSVVRKSPILWTARLRGVPAVVHGHSYDFAGWVASLPRAARPVVRWALPADRWLVLGSRLAAEYAQALRLAPDRIEVLYNPVPPALPALPTGGRIDVVALGRLGRRKGSYDLIDAVAALDPALRARMHLTLAGDGEVERVRAAASALGGAVTVRDWLTPAERDELLSTATVFALPSYEEGLPMALLEAMAAGLVPLTSPVGGIPEAITDGADGLLVPPGDVPALTAALARIITEPQLRARLSDGARLRAADFDIADWYARLGEIWRTAAR
ncbi:glycosyltransferase family 4 protein [Tsukamurella serpentis]